MLSGSIRLAWIAALCGFAAVAMLTLGLGIGLNIAIFSVIYATLLRPLPYPQPGELVRIYETKDAPGNYPMWA